VSRLEIDKSTLKQPALTLVAVALMAAPLAWFSNQYKVDRSATLQQARSRLAVARDEYRSALEADSILNKSQQRYQRLRQRGFIGDEPRLVWIESLRAAGREHHLYNLQYNLHQRRSAQLTGAEPTQHYQLYTSAMQLQLELAHEVDLLGYFSDLARRRPAVYRVRGCSMKPLFTETGIALGAANVSAKCELYWYTVDSIPAPEAEEEGPL